MKEKTTNYEEKELRAPSGWAVLFLTIILYLAAIGLLIFCAVNIDEYSFSGYDAGMIVCIIWLCIGWVPFIGLRVIKPNEALVLTLFGKYIGTLKREGFYFVNIFSVPAVPKVQEGGKPGVPHTKISLKTMTPDRSRDSGGMARCEHREGSVQRGRLRGLHVDTGGFHTARRGEMLSV